MVRSDSGDLDLRLPIPHPSTRMVYLSADIHSHRCVHLVDCDPVPMRLIVAGSRSIRDWKFVWDTLDKLPRPTEVVSGMAAGPDIIGYHWATSNNIPVRSFPASWSEHGKAAGPIRNAEMAIYADALVAFDAGTRGTGDMIRKMRNLNKPTIVIEYRFGSWMPHSLNFEI